MIPFGLLQWRTTPPVGPLRHTNQWRTTTSTLHLLPQHITPLPHYSPDHPYTSRMDHPPPKFTRQPSPLTHRPLCVWVQQHLLHVGSVPHFTPKRLEPLHQLLRDAPNAAHWVVDAPKVTVAHHLMTDEEGTGKREGGGVGVRRGSGGQGEEHPKIVEGHRE